MHFIIGCLLFCVWGQGITIQASDDEPRKSSPKYVTPHDRSQVVTYHLVERLKGGVLGYSRKKSLLDYTVRIEGINCQWSPEQGDIVGKGRIVLPQSQGNKIGSTPQLRISLTYMGYETVTAMLISLSSRSPSSYALLIELRKEQGSYDIDFAYTTCEEIYLRT